ncbi:MAG: thiamine pyrophosphate-binding protein [Pseudomonas sp.]
MSIEAYSIPASDCVSALQRNHVDHVVTVPDWVQLSLHSKLELGIPGIKLVNCCNENQTVTVAAGLTVGGKKPLLMMQNQGLYNCVNTLRAVCLDAHIPLVFMVGQFGREFDNIGKEPTESRRTMVRIMEPMLKAIDVPFFRLDTAADLGLMDQAYALAKERRNAVVLLVSAPLAWR